MKTLFRTLLSLSLLLLVVFHAVPQSNDGNNDKSDDMDVVKDLHFDVTSMHLYKSHEVLLSVHSNQLVHDYHVVLSDENGKLVQEYDFHETDTSSWKVNTDSIGTGIYHIQISVGSQVYKTGTLII